METVTKIEISKEALAKARLKEAYDLFKHEWIDNKIFDKLQFSLIQSPSSLDHTHYVGDRNK